MISMVVEDTLHSEIPVTELPHLTAYIKQKEPIEGSLFALSMNGWILDILSGRVKQDKYPILTNYDSPTGGRVIDMDGKDRGWANTGNNYWVRQAQDFIKSHFPDDKRVTVAGKNVAGFDMKFMPPEISNLFKHKVIDPAGYYWHPWEDSELPNLSECKARAGLHTPVAHDAREDAMDVIQLIRKVYE